MDLVLVAFLLTFTPIAGIILCGLIRQRREFQAERAKALSLISVARGGRIQRSLRR